jgi:hypothetical protein
VKRITQAAHGCDRQRKICTLRLAAAAIVKRKSKLSQGQIKSSAKFFATAPRMPRPAVETKAPIHGFVNTKAAHSFGWNFGERR